VRGKSVVLIAWWLYVYTQTIVPSTNPAYGYLAWQWVPRERFLHREFCEFRARQLRREGHHTVCQYVND
jgi:hypothetical protein